MTECTQTVFSFVEHFSRRVESSFSAPQVSSDGGSLLLRQTDRRIKLLDRAAACFDDQRLSHLIQHPLAEMLRQRVYGLALGYENLNDHEQLRSDPLMGVLAGWRNRRVSSPSSSIKRARAGPGSAAWWPRQSIWRRAAIRASS